MDLPELKDADTTPLALGDWLASIGPTMSDISNVSHEWWQVTMKKATANYELWRQATPLERLRLVPKLPDQLQSSRFLRTEQRGVSMLLKAIPDALRTSLVSEREMSSTAILYRLLTTYQPGGTGERSTLLRNLTEPKFGKTIGEATVGLRAWRRHYLRAQEIGAALPDSTLLLRALETAAQMVSKAETQASFRLAQSRVALQVDEKPDESRLWDYSQCLLAELDSLQLGQEQPSTTKSSTGTQPSVKALQPGSGSAATTSKPCRYWGTEQGCRAGKACKYPHPTLPDAKERCWNCSATTHRKAECPVKSVSGGSTQMPVPSGGSDAGGKGKNKSKKGGGGKGSSTATTTSNGKGVGTEGETDTKEVCKVAKSQSPLPETTPSPPMAEASTNAPTSGTGEMELMSEVTSLLRSLRGPQIRAIKMKKLDTKGETTILLDGGATHPLRCAANDAEWDRAQEITVQLAHGSTTMRQVP